MALRLMQPQVSPDGRHVLGVTRAGWHSSRLETLGGALHVGIVDLERLVLSLPLPISFSTPNVDRWHSDPRWCSAPASLRPFDIAESVRARMTPMDLPSPEVQENRDRHHRFAAIQLTCIDAGPASEKKVGYLGWMLEEGLAFAEPLLQDGMTEGSDAWSAAWIAARLADVLRSKGETGDDNLRRRALEYLRLCISMGFKVEVASQWLQRLNAPPAGAEEAAPITSEPPVEDPKPREGRGGSRPHTLLSTLVPAIEMGYILQGSCPADTTVRVLVETLRVTSITKQADPTGSDAWYTIERRCDFGWAAEMIPLESPSGDGSLVLFWAGGGTDRMAALAVDLDGISLRSLAKRVRGKWYTLSKSRVAEGTVDIRKVASDRNPRAGHHEVGRLLAEYSPVVIDMTGLPETDSALGQDSMADPSEATVAAPTAYVHESTNWRVIGKVDDDGYVSESANWRTVGKVDRSGYVSESANPDLSRRAGG